jgi:hypothetical protein
VADVRARTLRKAADIVGGRDALRGRLHVSALVLALWMSGVESPPTDAFLKAVDIVEEAKLASVKTRLTPPPRT